MIRLAAVGSAVAVIALAAGASASAATGPVGQWALDEGSGTTAADGSGLGNHAVIEGGVSWTSGKIGGALRFDGAGGRLRAPVSSALEPAGLTVSAWVKNLGGPGRYRYLVAKGANGCIAGSWGLYSGPEGGIMFYVADSGGVSFTRSPDGGAAIWDGAWHYVAGSYDGAVVRLYVDGAQVGSGTPASAAIGYGLTTTNDLFVGSYPGCSGLDFDGTVDLLRIWGRALAPTEVTASMAYDFRGFLRPVDNPPTVNQSKAGSAIPVKFSLGGNQGLGILAAGSPASQQVVCSSTAPTDDLETTSTSGSSSLSYDAASDTYSYVWKSDKSWAGTCRRLVVALDDGSTHVANFKFK